MVEYKVCQIKKSKSGKGGKKMSNAGRKIGTYKTKTFPALNSTIEVNGIEKKICSIELPDSEDEDKIIIVDDIKKGD